MIDVDEKERQKRERQKNRFISKASQTAAKYLRRMEELPGAPSAMQPFFRCCGISM
ncbi:MAG: hypothetical protein SO016_06055 [Lachnospiraceae bacterium]|nr:hypothetical protein [Robinsoniella sp.]MDY3766248.1 hypothetical protein [Lachnospiraceae bacterium]